MKFTVAFNIPSLSSYAYEQYLGQYMEDWLKQAAQLWLEATVDSKIPTWSRASRATFEKLAEEVGYRITYGAQKSNKDRHSLGRNESTGGISIEASQGKFYFTYGTTLRYLAYNEYNRAVYGTAPNVFSRDGIKNTPYNFQLAGERQFEDFTRFTELPSPYRFLTTRKV